MNIISTSKLCLIASALISSISFADTKIDLDKAEHMLRIVLGEKYIMTAFLQSECAQYTASVDFPKEDMDRIEKDILEIEALFPVPDSKLRLRKTVNNPEFRKSAKALEYVIIQDSLALGKQKKLNPAFTCGIVFSTLKESLRDANHELVDLINSTPK